MKCGPTHYAGCDCHEKQWKEKLEKAERERDDARNQRDKLAEALERTANDFVTFRKVARANGIVGMLGLESLELAAAALASVKGGAE